MPEDLPHIQALGVSCNVCSGTGATISGTRIQASLQKGSSCGPVCGVSEFTSQTGKPERPDPAVLESSARPCRTLFRDDMTVINFRLSTNGLSPSSTKNDKPASMNGLGGQPAVQSLSNQVYKPHVSQRGMGNSWAKWGAAHVPHESHACHPRRLHAIRDVFNS